jgi:hypothetical protein
MILGSQQYGMIACYRIYICLAHTHKSPPVKRKARAQQPTTFREECCALSHTCQGLFHGRGVVQLDLAEFETVLPQVNMTIVKPGEQTRSLEIDDLRLRSLKPPHLGARAHRYDAALLQRQGLSRGSKVVLG